MCLAIIGARGRFVGSNPEYTDVELRNLFKISKVKLFIVQDELLDSFLVSTAATEHGIPISSIFRFRPLSTEPNWLCSFPTTNKLLDYGEKHWHQFLSEFPEESRSEIAVLMSTSGTTGRPKVAAISHYALIAQCKLLLETKPTETLEQANQVRILASRA